jgi:hypothetical protein
LEWEPSSNLPHAVSVDDSPPISPVPRRVVVRRRSARAGMEATCKVGRGHGVGGGSKEGERKERLRNRRKRMAAVASRVWLRGLALRNAFRGWFARYVERRVDYLKPKGSFCKSYEDACRHAEEPPMLRILLFHRSQVGFNQPRFTECKTT